MLPFQIKICGITTSEDAMNACRYGADAIGLNFFERSSRFVDGETAGLIASSVDEFNRQIAETPHSQVKKIGVFVDMPVPELVAIAWHVGLDGIQLHGNESPLIIRKIRSELEKLAHHCVLIRAVKSKPAEPTGQAVEMDMQSVSAEITAWIEQKVDLILLDAAVPGQFGGTGMTVDLSKVPKIVGEVPFVLAGGLTPQNVAKAIRESGYGSVDVASGVESAPGVKDQREMKAFIDAARSAFGLD